MARYVDKEGVKQYLLDRGLYLTAVKNALEINTVADVEIIALLRKQIADTKRSVYSPNTDYMTGYVCALSVVEGIIAGLEDTDTCVVCGDVVPEGRQVCPNCEETTRRKNETK